MWYSMNFSDGIVDRFFLCCNPPTVTHQEKKIVVNKKTGKPHTYEPPELKDARELYLSLLNRHRPAAPLSGPAGLQVDWYFPTRRKSQNDMWKTTKPDTDNLNKLLKDCMTECGFWKDDAQVVREVITKMWSYDFSGIMVTVYDLSKFTPDGAKIDRKGA